MAGAGDCLGYAHRVGSARFARSAADRQAGWAPLALLAPALGFANAKNTNVTEMLLDVDRVDGLTGIYFRF